MTRQGGTTCNLELVFPALVGCHEAAVTHEGVVPRVKEEKQSRDVEAVEEVRKVLLTAFPLSRANLAREQRSRQHRQVHDRAWLIDRCASVYRQKGRPFLDPACNTRIYTEIYMDEPKVQPNGSMQYPSTFFEVVEWNPLDATHRLLLRNALVAHLQLSQLFEHVGHFWTHPIRNAFLLKQDSTSNLATAAKSLRAPASGDGNATMVSHQHRLTFFDHGRWSQDVALIWACNSGGGRSSREPRQQLGSARGRGGHHLRRSTRHICYGNSKTGYQPP